MGCVNCSKISLLIPSLNRSDFLIRLIRYYCEADFEGHVLIGDSSNECHADNVKVVLKGINRNLNVRYFDCRGLNDSETIAFLSDQAVTPYVAFVADDDFLIPHGISDAINFLDNNDDYSVAHGKAALFTLSSPGAYGQLEGISSYSLRTLKQLTASERLASHLDQYFVTLFSVHRVEDHRLAYTEISKLKDKSFTELLPSCMASIQGKVKQLDSLYLIRQAHDARYVLPGFMDWIANVDWPDSYEMFRQRLAMELVDQDGISVEKAERVVCDAFQSYIWKCLFFNKLRPQKTLKSRISGVIHKSNILSLSWACARSIFPKEQYRFHLGNFRNTSFKYYADFRPIYDIVTGDG